MMEASLAIVVEITPGAFSFSSKYAIFFLKIDPYNCCLILIVTFSPMTPNADFYPIIVTIPTTAQIVMKRHYNLEVCSDAFFTAS